MKSNIPLAIVDLETTGTNPRYDRIIEIGILRIENGKVIERYNTLINPERRLPEYITAITGITNDMLDDAPTFADVQETIQNLCDNAIFVAHNVRFDYGFLKQEFARLESTFTKKLLCTVELSRKLFPHERRHDLSSIIERFGFRVKARHRAFDDALVLWDFLKHLARKPAMRTALMATIAEMIERTPKVPPLLSKNALKNLPEGPGVYIFYGKQGEPLYVGKSVNIKTRVLSHFSAHTATDMKEQRLRNEVTDIETQETHGEFSALLRELELIKSLQPVYNRIARKVKTMTIMREQVDAEGYKTVAIERVLSIEGSEYGSILGIFRSMKQAEEFLYALAQDKRLCPERLGLERGRHGCFAYSLKRCNGACIGEEAPYTYNARFDGAFTARRIRIWPFAGPVLFEERSASGGTGRSFLIHDWRVIKRFTYDEAGVNEEAERSPLFDYDAYKVLVKFLLDPKYKRSIRPLDENALPDHALAYE